MQKSFTGLSFPFRVSNQGGVVMSSTDVNKATHIEEAITQILLTKKGERTMEHYFGSEIDTLVFEPNDVSLRTLLSYQIKEALTELEDRITVNSIEIISEDSKVIAEINYTVKIYNESYSTQIEVGDFQ